VPTCPPKARIVRVRAEEHDGAVPRISEFYGIVIEMYFGDQPPAHFHERYGGEEATIVIASRAVLAGSLLGRAQRLVREWLAEHREELNANWERTRTHEAPEPIAPLT
jgi:hypothetical protein